MLTLTRRPTYKLGKRPASEHPPVKLRLADFFDHTAVLPEIPDEYGHENLVDDWGMLGNNIAGCCFWSGFDHQFLLWTTEAGRPASFTDACTLADYAAATGYSPDNPASDQGTNLLDGLKYVQTVGVIDADGARHQVGAYLALEPGNITQLHVAAYLFDGVGIGVEFPDQWMTAFSAGYPWDAIRTPQINGGHYITAVCRRKNNTGVVSWGRIVWLTDAGYRQFNDETYVYIAPDRFNAGGLDIDGFDAAALRRYLQAIGRL
jgi:hypothetical protein